MTTPVHDDWNDWAHLYVVDALTDDERRDFEAHLAGCTRCRPTVAELSAVTERLSQSVAAEPPAGLRAHVLAAIAAEPVALASRRPAVESEPAAATSTDPVTVVSLSRPRRSQRFPTLVAAAAVTLALVCGGWALASRHQAQQADSTRAQLTSLLASHDVHTVSGTAGGASATLVVSESRNEAVFVAGNMPTLPDGKVYELWTITGPPRPAGTFSGADSTVVSLPTAAVDATLVAVTVEPAGGSAHPTTQPIMSLDVPRAS
jgi:anti-sigma-K factor RskA